LRVASTGWTRDSFSIELVAVFSHGSVAVVFCVVVVFLL